MVKNGRTALGKQRYICRNCKRTQIESYTYNVYDPSIDSQIITLTMEGLDIRSTARFLGISTTTLLRRIAAIAQNIPQPLLTKKKSMNWMK